MGQEDQLQPDDRQAAEEVGQEAVGAVETSRPLPGLEVEGDLGMGFAMRRTRSPLSLMASTGNSMMSYWLEWIDERDTAAPCGRRPSADGR